MKEMRLENTAAIPIDVAVSHRSSHESQEKILNEARKRMPHVKFHHSSKQEDYQSKDSLQTL